MREMRGWLTEENSKGEAGGRLARVSGAAAPVHRVLENRVLENRVLERSGAESRAADALGSGETGAAGSASEERADRRLAGRLRWIETTLRRLVPGFAAALPGVRPSSVPADARRVSQEAEGWEMLAHDARNMLAALELYCDLLEEPGVLEPGYRHYAGELRLVAGASQRLIEKLGALGRGTPAEVDRGRNREDAVRGWQEAGEEPRAARAGEANWAKREPAARRGSEADRRGGSDAWNGLDRRGGIRGMDRPDPTGGPGSSIGARSESEGLGRAGRRASQLASEPIGNLAEELLANKNLLSALAGPAITLGMHFDGGARPIGLSGEDLTRVLVNLVRNAAEAMPGGGHIQIGVEERDGKLRLSVSDTGCGIPDSALESVFEPGYSTRLSLDRDAGRWPARHRGLGLSIVRSLVVEAGGAVWAANRGRPAAPGGNRSAPESASGETCGASPPGTVICLEFPVAGTRAA